MSIFNPQLPDTRDPNYLGYSKSISQPNFAGDTSAGIAIGGIGDLIGKGLQATDKVVQTGIGDQLNASIDSVREAYRKDLDAADTALKQRTQLASADPNAIYTTGTQADTTVGLETPPLNILPKAESPLPKDLSSLTASLSTLGDARANNKLSETAYYGRLDAMAKDFRSRFPGYRDWIDDRIQHITGVNPANAYIKSVIGDINAATSASNKQQEHFETFVRTHIKELGGQGPGLIAAVRAGLISDVQGYAEAQKNLVYEHSLDLQVKKSAALKADNAMRESYADSLTSFYGSGEVAKSMNAFMISMGKGDPQKFSQFMLDYNLGKITPDSAQSQQLQSMILGERNRMYNVMKEWFYTPYKDDPKRSPAIDLGSDAKVEEKLKSFLNPYDMAADQFGNKQHGQAYFTARMTEAERDADVMSIRHNKDYGPPLRILSTVNKEGGPNVAASWMTRIIGLGRFKPSEAGALVTQFGEMANSPEYRRFLPPREDGTPGVMTPNDALKNGRRSGSNIDQNPAYVKAIAEQPAAVITSTDPQITDAIKIGYAQGAFAPENNGFLKNFDRDVINPNTGLRTTGRNWVFQKWTDDATAREMWRLGQKDPQVWRDYIGWSSRNFQSDIFNEEINDLKSIAANPNMRIIYNDKNNTFKLETGLNANPLTGKVTRPPFNPGTEASQYYSATNQADIQRANASIDRLNLGLSGMANIYTASGLDQAAVKAYTLNLLMTSGAGDSPYVQEMIRQMKATIGK